MSDTKMIKSPAMPTNPDVGDIHIQHDEQADVWRLYVWDGDKWLDGIMDIPDSPKTEEVDTPEKAYDRAMGILG